METTSAASFLPKVSTITPQTSAKPVNLSGAGLGNNIAGNVGGIQTSTPQTNTGNGVLGNFVSGIGSVLNNLQGGAALNGAANQPTITPTATGGFSFPPSIAKGYSAPAATVASNTSTPNTEEETGLAQYVNNNFTTPNGGTVTTSGGAGGNITGYTPSQFSIDTSGTVPSSSLESTAGANDVQNQQSQYQDYVNAVAQAQGYSPQYIQALQQQYGAQTAGAELGLNSALINSNLQTGAGFTGYSTDQATTRTGQEQAQNSLNQGVNQIAQLSANQALNTQQLSRTGNIAAAQTQLQSSPVGMSGANAIQQYNNLQQQYPNANIPAYNPNLSPEQNQQMANQLVAQSPAYQAGFSSTYQTPGGGTGILNKLNLSGFQQNSDGSLTLVPSAAAALGSANASIVQNQATNLSNINSAVDASSKTLSSTVAFMNQYGLNQSDVPIINQIQNSTNAQLPKAGALSAFKADLNGLRADYAQYLIGRGGSIAGTNDEANSAIPDNISPAQLQTVVQQMQTVGQNTADALSTQINQALQGIQGNTVAGQGDSTQNNTAGTSDGWY